MVIPLAPGTRIKVLRDPDFGPGPWPAEPVGIIDARDRDVAYEIVQTKDGPARIYWVTFDEPQRDVENGGPYTCAQVLERYIRPES
jgi:hypothetical protein